MASTDILFSESADGPLQPLPPWARFLIDFGYAWPRKEPGNKRIALISMPCESAAAGLVLMGALIRDLGDAKANDRAGHVDRIVAYCRQFLDHCQRCSLETCDSKMARCGFDAKSDGILRSSQRIFSGMRFQVKRHSGDAEYPFWMLPHKKGGWMTPSIHQDLHHFHIDGQPPPVLERAREGLQAEPYAALVESLSVLDDNLQTAYSGLCFAGHVSGAAATRSRLEQITFLIGGRSYRLSELLTVHGWSSSQVSRVAFFNSRTKVFDRNVVRASLVVADGDVSCRRVKAAAHFQQSDLIAIIDRTIDRNRLADVGQEVAPSQWYRRDADLLSALPAPPKGISVAIVKGG